MRKEGGLVCQVLKTDNPNSTNRMCWKSDIGMPVVTSVSAILRETLELPGQLLVISVTANVGPTSKNAMNKLDPAVIAAAKATLPTPANQHELWIVAALIYCPTSRAWFREMGFTLGAVLNPACQTLAVWGIMCAPSPPREVREALAAVSDRTSIGEWIAMVDDAAVEAWVQDHGFLIKLQTSLRALSPRWVPQLMRWAARQIETGKNETRAVQIAAQALAFAAWRDHQPGKLWIYEPGIELKVEWPEVAGVPDER